MYKLVLVRHGQSTWNKEKKFTGWTDVELTQQGIAEAKEAAKLLKEDGFTFDLAYTSVLKRAIDTLDIILNVMGLVGIPIKKTWKLNERHYGALQGFNKVEMAQKVGEEQVHIWRRSYDVRPPALTEDDPRYSPNDPLTESLKDTVERFVPYWNEVIAPSIKDGKKIIISAHGNSLRALVMHLDNIPEDEIVDLNIPTGVPLVYELDENLKPIRHYYLGNPEEIEAAAKAVSDQSR